MQEFSMKTQKHTSKCKFCLKPVAAAKGSMPQIFQASLQQYVNQELPEVHAGFRRVRETGDPIANIRCITEKPREFHTKKKSTSSLSTLKSLTVWITTNCGKFFKR